MIAAVRCECGIRHVVALQLEGWSIGSERADRLEAVSLSALRGGWIWYRPTSQWSCPACVDRSDHRASSYQAAASSAHRACRDAVRL